MSETTQPSENVVPKEIDPLVTKYKNLATYYFNTPELGGNRLNRESRGTILDHCVRMVEILKNCGINVTPQLEAGIWMHDIAAEISKNEDKRKLFMTEFVNRGEVTEKDMYVLGIALATDKFEDAAEEWRNVTNGFINSFSENSDKTTAQSHDIRIIQRLLSSLYPKTIPIETIKAAIAMTLSNDSAEQVPDELWGLRLPRVDIERKIETLKKWDIEGSIIKAVEVIDNLKHPHPRKETANWRDAQELLSFHGPLLEAMGQSELAMLAHNTALRYLNEHDKKYNERHRKGDNLKENIANYQNKLRTEVENTGIVDNILELIHETFPPEMIARYDDKEILFHRVKGESIYDKGAVKGHKGKYDAPDGIAFRLGLRDDLFVNISDDELFDYINNNLGLDRLIIALGERFGIIPGRSNETDPPEAAFEIIIGNSNRFGEEKLKVLQREYTINGDKILVSVVDTPKRKSGYQAIHLNFVTSTGIGVEIQILRESDWLFAEFGGASHIFYKNSNSIGGDFAMTEDELRNLEGRSNLTVQEEFRRVALVNKYTNAIENIRTEIMGIRRRFQIFSKQTNNFRLTDSAMGLVADLLSDQLQEP